MTIDKHPEHAPFSSTSTRSTSMPDRAWNMDESTRNRLLKKYKTQVASATSTVCATLSVVSAPGRRNLYLYLLWGCLGRIY